MSLYEHLLVSRTKEELAKEVVKLAKERAALKDEVDALKHEVFWMKVKERDDGTPNSR